MLLRVLRLMRKVKQSAWRRQGEGELDGVTIAAVDLPEQLMRRRQRANLLDSFSMFHITRSSTIQVVTSFLHSAYAFKA